jgi:peptide deformylase
MENEILKIGEPLLKTIATPVIEFNDHLKVLVNNLYTLLTKYQGAGLAASQLGITKRVLVYGLENNPRYPGIAKIPFNTLINPVILHYSEEQEEFFEGCLSIPNIRGPVLRSSSIAGYAQDLTGTIVPFESSGFLSRIIQHEVDHLNGIMFLQRVKDNSRIIYTNN